jgi:hypothetical protein
MSVDLEPREVSEPQAEGEFAYRTLSSTAVLSMVVGLLSAAALLDWTMLAIPALGILIGFGAIRSIRRRPDELTGLGLAKAGLVTSIAFLVVGFSWLSYVYAVEVPEGYARISYDDLQPSAEKPKQGIPDSAMALNGKNVFIKGYVFPGRDNYGIREFLLVRDQGDCCFGGQPKITDRIQVKLADPEQLTFRTSLHKLAGTFRIKPTEEAVDAGGGVLYFLEEAHLR